MAHSSSRSRHRSVSPRSSTSGERVLAQRLEEAVPVGVVGPDGRDERLLDEAGEEIEDVAFGDVAVGDHRFGRVEAEVGGEDREAYEQLPFSIGEEVVAPRHHRFEGALTRPQQPKAVVEAARDLFEGKNSQASSGEFDGERQAIETATDLRDGADISGAGVETGNRRRRPHHEELDGIGLARTR